MQTNTTKAKLNPQVLLWCPELFLQDRMSWARTWVPKGASFPISTLFDDVSVAILRFEGSLSRLNVLNVAS